MKLPLVCFLPVLAASLAFAADPVTGKWQIHSTIAGNESDQTCTFNAKNQDLTGTCTSDKGTVNITGKMDDKKVTWTYKSDYNGSPLTVNYEGKRESGTKITGTVTVAEFSVDGDFTATQSQ
jgi:hypothetical protein